MDTQFQKRFALILTMIFFVVTPLFILYAMGFRFESFDGGFRPQIRATGGIRINPRNQYQVIIDGEIATPSPLYREGLDTGTIDVTLLRPGFQSWDKTLEIEPSRVTLVDSVILFPEDPDSEPISSGPTEVQDILPDPLSDNILYSALDPEQPGLWLYNPEAQTHTQLVDTIVDLELPIETQYEEIVWDSSSQQLSFSVFGNTGQRIFVINSILSSEPTILEITDTFALRPIDSPITVLSLEGSTLTFLQNEIISIKDLIQETPSRELLRNVSQSTTRGNVIYYQDSRTNDILSYNTLSRQSQTLASEFEIPIQQLAVPQTQSHLLIITETDEVYRMSLDNIDTRILRRIPEVFAQNLSFDVEGRKVLLQGKNTIHMMYLDDIEGYQRKQKGDVDLLYQTEPEDTLTQAKYFGPDQEHIIFQKDDTLLVVELDTRDTPNVAELLDSVTAFSDVAVSNQAVIITLQNDVLSEFRFPIRRAALF